MRVVELERGMGKTVTLVRKMLAPGNEDIIYVAPTWDQAVNVGLRTALAWGEPDTPELRARFVAAHHLPARLHKEPNARLVIDEADGVLSNLLGAPVEMLAYTPSGDWQSKEDETKNLERLHAGLDEAFREHGKAVNDAVSMLVNTKKDKND